MLLMLVVTMAKGLGNGIPLAAVVTTPEVAACMSPSQAVHFNTFGGNPLSCAVGSTVLDVSLATGSTKLMTITRFAKKDLFRYLGKAAEIIRKNKKIETII